MNKHTPGPWHYGELGEKIRAQQGRERPTFIAQMLDLHRGEEEKLANAALIAAAPDLYQHVTEYLELCEKMKDAKDSEERADYLSIMVGLKGEMKRTVERVKGKDRG